MHFEEIWKSLMRKKPMTVGDTKLEKCLSCFDLTILGIGSTLGVGVYIISGDICKNLAGPGIIISFAIAAFASLLAGLCYAEFGSRVPKAGSAYIYCYVTIGEFIAFIIGWNLILEYAIGSASVAKGISNYIDAETGGKISSFFIEYVPIHFKFFGTYADFFAFSIIIVLSIGLAFGAKESTAVNNLFAIINLLLIMIVIACGCLVIDINNWYIPSENVPSGYGDGGFLPYGITGVIRGAGVCFYAFIGFDVIATAGEEAKNPKKSIPISICVSLLIVFLSYFGVSTVLSLMVPYYNQDVAAPIPTAFESFGLTTVKQIITFGAVFGMLSSLFGAIFPLPRIFYAIAQDGLIFKIFRRIHCRFRTPLYGTLIAGLLTGLLAMLFDLKQLVNMMSIGTIMAYSLVAACVLLLRYRVDDIPIPADDLYRYSESSITQPDVQIIDGEPSFISQLFNTSRVQVPTNFSSNLVTSCVILYVIFCIWMSLVISNCEEKLMQGNLLHVMLLSIPIFCNVLLLIIISGQPKSSKFLPFKAPFCPWLPALSIMVNIHLMVELDISTWIRFVIWLGIGLIIYFGYGKTRPQENERIFEEDGMITDD